MAQTWTAKAPAEVVQRRWTVPVDSDDGLDSFTTSASGVTIDEDSVEGTAAVLTLSAGSAGTTGSVTFTATTSRGRVLVETFYIPIQVSTTALGYTARNFCEFALRKIVGNGEDPTATEMGDALERLNDMLAEWKDSGADVGAFLPLVEASVIRCPDSFAKGIKYNLRVLVHEHYGQELGPNDAREATRGLQRIKSANLPDKREPAVYY